MKANPLLNQMIQDMETQSDLYKPTSFWKSRSEMMIQNLHESGVQNFRASEKSILFFVPTYAFPPYLTDKGKFHPVKEALKNIGHTSKIETLKMENFLKGKYNAVADYRTFVASNRNCPPYTDKISESRIGNPLEQFEFDGRRFSRSFLNYLLGLNFLKQKVCTDNIKTVMEIGGGFGTLGEILLGDSRNNCFYINADIPPLSFVSTYYLQQVFGEKEIGGYNELRGKDILDIEVLKKQYRAIGLCTWQLPSLQGKIDLFVNFISFQEMEPQVVENYCRQIRRLEPDYVLLRNLKEGKQKRSKENPTGVINPIMGNDYDSFLPDYELIDTNTMVFGFLTDDGFHSQLRLYKRIGA